MLHWTCWSSASDSYLEEVVPFVLMWFELLDQLGNCMLSLFILLLNRWEGYAWNSVIHNVASGLPEALRLALCFPKWSCFFDKVDLVDSQCEFAWSTTRGWFPSILWALCIVHRVHNGEEYGMSACFNAKSSPVPDRYALLISILFRFRRDKRTWCHSTLSCIARLIRAFTG